MHRGGEPEEPARGPGAVPDEAEELDELKRQFESRRKALREKEQRASPIGAPVAKNVQKVLNQESLEVQRGRTEEKVFSEDSELGRKCNELIDDIGRVGKLYRWMVVMLALMLGGEELRWKGKHPVAVQPARLGDDSRTVSQTRKP